MFRKKPNQPNKKILVLSIGFFYLSINEADEENNIQPDGVLRCSVE